MNNDNIKKILDIFSNSMGESTLVKVFVSNPVIKNAEISKINIKPVLLKEKLFFQTEIFVNNKAYHENIDSEEILQKIQSYLNEYKQIQLVTMGKTYQILKNKKNYNVKILNNDHNEASLSHDKDRNYILKEGNPVLFLEKLGIMDNNGKVYKSKYDKFKQINKYLEFIDNTIKELQEKKLISDSIKCIDFGCGKSYLTFALYHYLKYIIKINFVIIGLDLKKDVIETCTKIAEDLKCENLEFLQGDIKDFHKLQNADLIFSLHACDNATDYAILKGLELGAKAIMAVPCCQHEFNSKMSQKKNSRFFLEENPIGKHGILLEKYTTLATDAFRGQALELCGYKVQIMEFIDMEHTPKNVLIKGIKSKVDKNALMKSKKEYREFKEFLGFEPLLDRLLREYFL
ncbi:class I SAM-dependent methyltransferase [Fusobacterium sp. PH5-44]|uniref:class I SAM-dependent methyltransferase n=1 Tax=unclassified Fusobacterium TaxID=2648384 RepID=UPI003D1F0FC5